MIHFDVCCGPPKLNGVMTIENCVISDNVALTGAIEVWGDEDFAQSNTTVNIINTNITNNTGHYGAGLSN